MFHFHYFQSISNILKKFDGEFILDYFQENENLNEQSRKMIGHILIKYFISKRVWLTRKDLDTLAAMVSTEFKGEDKNFYYKASEGMSKVPKGILFNRYTNQLHKYRVSNLIVRRNRNLRDASTQTGKYTMSRALHTFKLFGTSPVQNQYAQIGFVLIGFVQTV